MSFLSFVYNPDTRDARRAFLGQSGLLLSGAAVALMAGRDALAKGQKDKVTVEDIGGLECQKCHY